MDIELFDKRYVYLEWSDELEGKDCILAKTYQDLKDFVNSGDEDRFCKVNKGREKPFTNGWSECDFCYYDPNHRVKKAWIEGKTIQKRDLLNEWADYIDTSRTSSIFYNIKWDAHEWRIKPTIKENEKHTTPHYNTYVLNMHKNGCFDFSISEYDVSNPIYFGDKEKCTHVMNMVSKNFIRTNEKCAECNGLLNGENLRLGCKKMSESYKVLINESTFISFLNRLGDIFPNETYFVNTAFRSKKLTEKEKSKLGTRNREVYLSKYIHGSNNNRVDEESAIQKMYELEVPYKALTFNKGTEEEITLPQSAMVTFICCNPSIEEKVAMLHLESTNDILKNLVMCCDNGAEAKKQLAHHNKDFRSERMKCNRTKWVDFDIDIENLEELNREDIKSTIGYCFRNHATFSDINGMIVSTSGGFHVLIDKNCIKGNPHNFCTYLDVNLSQMKCKIKEIEFKSGCCMIPCVGTLQYGKFEVTYEDL